MLFSLLGTLAQWQVNPRKWLTWYLQSCAEAGGQAPADSTAYLHLSFTDDVLTLVVQRDSGRGVLGHLCR